MENDERISKLERTVELLAGRVESLQYQLSPLLIMVSEDHYYRARDLLTAAESHERQVKEFHKTCVGPFHQPSQDAQTLCPASSEQG